MAKKRKTKPVKKQSGGYLEGPSHEDGGIPAQAPGEPPIELEGGEYIINAATTEALGVEFLDKLNRTDSPHHSEPGFSPGELPGSNYEDGGYVRNNKGYRISEKLPEAYRVSDIVGENCSNCLFMRGKYCKRWMENVKNEYLCNVWVGNRLTKIRKAGEK